MSFYIMQLMELAQGRRGEYQDMKYLAQGRTTLVYELPLAELVNDFFDHMKSRSKGYASMEYSFIGYRRNDLVRLDVALNGEHVDALSCIVHKDKSYAVGKTLVKKLREIVPRAQFKIPIQAKIGAKVVASQQISALKKGTFRFRITCSLSRYLARITSNVVFYAMAIMLTFVFACS